MSSKHDAPTLSFLMGMLPGLHPLQLVRTKISTIRDLRLVSKEVGCLALTAIQSCEVGVSAGIFPDQQRLLKLLAEAQLQDLSVTVFVRSVPGATAVAEQLSSCVQHTECILAEINQAIMSVRGMTLSVRHQRIQLPVERAPEASALDTQQESEGSSADSGCPKPLGVVMGGVFALLAASVPNLQKLSLRGRCWDAALSSFGFSCPKLVSLDVHVPDVPLEALDGLGIAVPQLVSLSLGNTSVRNISAYKVSFYLNEFLPTTRTCFNLANLEINLSKRTHLELSSHAWLHIPASLTYLKCAFINKPSLTFSHLQRRVPSLCFADLSENLPDFLEKCPNLQKLEVLPGGWVSVWCGTDVDALGVAGSYPNTSLPVFKQRIVADSMSLNCDAIRFIGTSEQIQEVFSWLPEMPQIKHLKLKLDGLSIPLCVEHIHRLFPAAHDIVLADMQEAKSGVWGVEVLQPLVASQGITRLGLKCSQLSLTVSEVREVCTSLPNLAEIVINAAVIEGEGLHILRAELSKPGSTVDPNIRIKVSFRSDGGQSSDGSDQ